MASVHGTSGRRRPYQTVIKPPRYGSTASRAHRRAACGPGTDSPRMPRRLRSRIGMLLTTAGACVFDSDPNDFGTALDGARCLDLLPQGVVQALITGVLRPPQLADEQREDRHGEEV